MASSTSSPLKTALSVVIMVAIMAAAFHGLSKVLSEVSFDEIRAAMSRVGWGRIAIATCFGIASYLVLTGYDVIALKTIGRPLPWRQAAKASFVSYNLSHNLGFAVLTGAVARFRIYSAAGLNVADIAKITVLTGVSFWVGVLLMLGLCLVFIPDVASLAGYSIGHGAQAAIGIAIVSLNALYLAILSRGVKELGFRRWRVPLPTARRGVAQCGLSVLDLFFAASVLAVLMPGVDISLYPQVLVAYVAAFVTVMITHTPGGAGVLEFVVVMLIPGVDKAEVIAALILFRLVYHIGPFLLAVGLLVAHETTHRRSKGAGKQGLPQTAEPQVAG
ncbi:lysylphosphatidylglycerol synthase transmembrane domain-containing protein [Sphingomonas sp. 3-13AW]|uniref:lysylphosphatidylglycerol synthase transmembrane domain-containing protein n=1 Tax=Sphingomonas sp. 3-13AW TaxID=3050450 RepID=UPI003BB5BF09